MHNIAFFSNQFARNKGTGVARYARNLLRAFIELDTPFHIVPVTTWSDMKKDEMATFKVDTGLRLLPTRRIATRLLWTTINIPKIEHLLDFNVDLVHTSDLGYVVATSKPHVVTVHDIGPLTHPEFFNKDSIWIMRRNLEYAIKKARAFICVSQTTADSLVEYVQGRYSVDILNRIYVVHEGIAEHFFQTPDFLVLNHNACFDFLGKPFFLAVGKLSPRKNLETVIKALAKLKSSLPHHLVTVGGDGWDFQEVRNLVTSLGLSNRVHFLGYVNDRQLHALYAKATLFIYPSLFEGFGLPILEAMASGCPVITSNVSSLPEVAGDAALLVDPQSVESLAAALYAICQDHMLEEELKRQGQERAKMFSWGKCATETLSVYEQVVS